MPFNELFGGNTLLASNISYLSLTISTDTELQWPLEQQVGGTDVVATIIDLTASAPGLNVDMPDATLVSTGYSALFNNVGGQTVTIRDEEGGTIISLASGTAWYVYLVDNTDAAGTWRTFQLGASISVANAAALAGAGLKAIASTLNTRVPVTTKAVNYNVQDSDRAVALVWTSGVGTFTLEAAGTVGSDWYCMIKNLGSGDLTVSPPSGTIDGAVSKTFAAGSSSIVVCDGTNYFTVGFGGSTSSSSFSVITINVAGSGDYTLSGAELGQVGYKFTGILTGNRNIIVPGSTAEYWVDNSTTGAFSLFIKTVAQVPGVEVLQGDRNILYCDATNVLSAETSTVTFPIPIAQGGTGSTTATTARTALNAASLAANTFTDNQRVSSTAPGYELFESDASANNKLWELRANGEQLQGTVWDDGRSSSANWLEVDRTANVVDNINLKATTVQVNGQSVRDAAILTSGVIGTARLGTGTANATALLQGDGTWSQYTETGTYTGNFTGFGSAVTSTIRYRRVGNQVTIGIVSFTDVSNSTAFTENSGLMPVTIRPARVINLVIQGRDSGTNNFCKVQIATNGGMTFSRDGTGAW